MIAGYIGDGAPMLVRRALGDPDDEEFFKQALEFFLLYYRAHKLDTTVVYPRNRGSVSRHALAATASSGAWRCCPTSR